MLGPDRQKKGVRRGDQGLAGHMHKVAGYFGGKASGNNLQTAADHCLVWLTLTLRVLYYSSEFWPSSKFVAPGKIVVFKITNQLLSEHFILV